MRYDILDCAGHFSGCFAGVKEFLGCPVYRGGSAEILAESRDLEDFFKLKWNSKS